MIFLITGATSFIGVALAKLLIAQGQRVIAVCRKDSKGLQNLPEGISVVYAEMYEYYDLAKTIEHADVFVHLAWAGTSHEGRHDTALQDDNVRYSLQAIDVAKAIGCQLFVEAGSQAEYGYTTELLKEDMPCHPDNEYGRAKYEFGIKAEEKCKELGIKFMHLRIISIYGETDHQWTLVMSCIRKMLRNEPVQLSSCEQMWNFVCIQDAVKQMYLLSQYALGRRDYISEVYHIGSNDTRKLRSFVDEMYHLTNSKSKLEFGKYTPANVVSLNPCMDKTEAATGGFISDYTFGQIVINIINNYKNHNYD